MRRLALASLLLLRSALSLAQPCDTPRFGPAVSLDTSRARALATGDFNGDGIQDVAFATDDGSGVVVLLLTTNGTVAARKVLSTTGTSVEATDVNRDGIDDLVVASTGPSSRIGLWLGRGSGELQPAGQVDSFSAVSGPKVVDWDGDGWPDVAVLAVSAVNGLERVLLIFQNTDGTHLIPKWSIELAFSPTYAPTILAVGDFDRDGRGDVALAGFASLAVAFGGEPGTVVHAGGIGGRPSAIRVADLDGDGNLDIVLAGCDGLYGCMAPALEVSWGDGHRSFAWSRTPTPSWAGSLADVIAGDFNGDGWTDLAITGWSGVGVLSGTGPGRSFTGAGPLFSASAPLGVLDLFHDARPDLLLGLSGLSVLPNACGTGDYGATLLVPFVIDADGAEGTHYASRVAIANRGASPAVDVELAYTSAFGNGTGTGRLHFGARRELERPALELLALAGIAVPPRGDGGTLRLRFTGLTDPADAGAHVVVTAQRGTEPPTRVLYPAVPLARALGAAEALPWLRETSTERTNLALSNVGAAEDGAVTLRVTLTPDAASAGTPATVVVALAPGEFRQLGSVLAPYGWSGGFARVERTAGTAPWLAWAVVHDRPTGDASFLLAEPPGRLAGVTSLVVPAVVDTDRFTSDLLLANAGSAPLAVMVEDSLVTLAPLEQRRITNVGPVLFPGHAGLSQAVTIRAVAGDLSGLFASALTHARGSGVGVLAPSSAPVDLAREEAFVPLPTCCPAYANLVIRNPSSASATFGIQLVDGESGPVGASTRIALPAQSSAQLSNVTAWLGAIVRSGWVRITREGQPGPFLAFGVSMEGEGPAAGTGDGAWIPMEVVR